MRQACSLPTLPASGSWFLGLCCEAEAELALMNCYGIIDAVLTDDSDMFAFGAWTVLCKYIILFYFVATPCDWQSLASAPASARGRLMSMQPVQSSGASPPIWWSRDLSSWPFCMEVTTMRQVTHLDCVSLSLMFDCGKEPLGLWSCGFVERALHWVLCTAHLHQCFAMLLSQLLMWHRMPWNTGGMLFTTTSPMIWSSKQVIIT